MIWRYTAYGPERVLSGPGALRELPAELDRLGGRRALIIAGRTLSTHTDVVAELEANLASRLAGRFAGAAQHVPEGSVAEAERAAREVGADTLIAVGGGSPIDTAKMVALRAVQAGRKAPLQIAVPTTLSAGEYTHAAGVTEEATRIKRLHIDTRIQPRCVVLDPEACRTTPRQLWLTTGVKALEHAVETLWWPRPHPLLATLALGAIGVLRRELVASAEPGATAARLACQHAAWMSLFGLLNAEGARLRFSHPLGHQIGARWDIPHGVTSCIVLPAAFRFLAGRTAAAQTRIGQALGAPPTCDEAEGAARAAAAVETLIASLGVPRTLSAAGARRDEIPAVAEAVAGELHALGSPDAELATPTALIDLLEGIW